MDKHEPGPWTYAPVVDGEGTRKFVIQPILAYVRVDDPERDEANIRLMTAAPELLEACERLVAARDNNLLGESHWDSLFDAARKAIAKAKGE